MTTPFTDVCIPRWHTCKHDWRVAKLTELLLTGHSWKTVRNILSVSKAEFDQLLDDAVELARTKQGEVCRDYLDQEYPAA
jgi:hypothetical protein